MEKIRRMKMLADVFDPRPGESVLVLVDHPSARAMDNADWTERRAMARDWLETLREMGRDINFRVSMVEYPGAGQNNAPIPDEIGHLIAQSNLVLALTEFSATSSIKPICESPGSTTRAASMPGVTRFMEDTAMTADYLLVAKYAAGLERMLNQSETAIVNFSTGASLRVDLRNRTAEADKGECSIAGKFINFPSGEALKVPYEACGSERDEFGESRTNGTIPLILNGELVRLLVENNRIVEVIGATLGAQRLRAYFRENPWRSNIAELGIGCNPMAAICGKVLMDEKVGLHIAYGISAHLGGKVGFDKCDIHEDMVFAKECPVVGTNMVLSSYDGSRKEIIRDGEVQYGMVE